MNLKPINPYYRRPVLMAATDDAPTYFYSYDWQEPVTDRTAEDVEHARELLGIPWTDMTADQQTEFLVGLKGSLNRSDLERIENNIQILLDVLEISNTSNVGNVPEFPTTTYFSKMRTNLVAIRSSSAVHTDTPAVPSLPFNTWDKINAIEQILADVYEVARAQFHYFASEIYAGDDTALIL